MQQDNSTSQASLIQQNQFAIIQSLEARNVRIILNTHNLDACLAATIIAADGERTDTAYGHSPRIVDTVHYDRLTYRPGTRPVRNLIILGVEMTDADLLQEIRASGATSVKYFRYGNALTTVPKINPSTIVAKYEEITPFGATQVVGLPAESAGTEQDVPAKKRVLEWFVTPPAASANTTEENSQLPEEGDLPPVYHDNNITSLVLGHYCNPTEGDSEREPEFKRLIRVVRTYVKFEKLEGVFNFENNRKGKKAKVLDDDMSFLYSNMHDLKRAALAGRSFYPTTPKSGEESYYLEPIQQARDYISRGMTDKHFSHGGVLSTLPCVCVGEEAAQEVMRQMSHAFRSFVTYEDVRTVRIWRIYTRKAPSDMTVYGHRAKRAKSDIDLVRLALEAKIEWIEAGVHHFLTEIPKFNEKVQH